MTGRLKVLVSAYACSPFRGSEAAVGWGYVAALARRHDLWVIVEEEKCRADVERYLYEHPDFAERVHFHFICKRRNRRLRKIWPPSYYWYYRRWHRDALRLARELHRQQDFDLVHQLTMVGFREPGYLWQMGLPFVWGPVGGMGLFPWRFLSKVGLYGACYYLGYNLYNALQMRLARRPRMAAASAGEGLFFATRENAESARQYWSVNGRVLSEVGMPRMLGNGITERDTGEPLQLVWSGLHSPRKALNIALEALSQLPATVEWSLHILGEGPQTARWKALADRLGVADRCCFVGWVEREEALALMRESHVMLISSLRDLTSTVTVEAIALGLPVICPDHCGFADSVDASCGIRIAVDTPGQFAHDMASAVAELYRDESKRRQLALGALIRARDFSWEGKAAEVDSVYRQRIARSSGEQARQA